FFFSSRRRHTRFSRDWSSDVCSSDLISHPALKLQLGRNRKCFNQIRAKITGADFIVKDTGLQKAQSAGKLDIKMIGRFVISACRSEERRVGKECRSWL